MSISFVDAIVSMWKGEFSESPVDNEIVDLINDALVTKLMKSKDDIDTCQCDNPSDELIAYLLMAQYCKPSSDTHLFATKVTVQHIKGLYFDPIVLKRHVYNLLCIDDDTHFLSNAIVFLAVHIAMRVYTCISICISAKSQDSCIFDYIKLDIDRVLAWHRDGIHNYNMFLEYSYNNLPVQFDNLYSSLV